MEDDQRLSRMLTQWSIVRQAHQGAANDRCAAQRTLLERYGEAIRRYLLAALRDADAADEVFQDFALRFVRGDFHSADPAHGKFRSFLKTIVSHMVTDHHRRVRRRVHQQQTATERMEPDDSSPSPASAEADRFLTSWREALLARCWEQLRVAEEREGRLWYTVLRHRVDHPQLPSEQLAEQLSARLGKPLTSGNLRVLVHRAREKFAELLLNEVAETLDGCSLDQLEEELIELRLHGYCRETLARLRN